MMGSGSSGAKGSETVTTRDDERHPATGDASVTLRPGAPVVAALSFIAALGLVPAIVFVAHAPGWAWLAMLLLGCGWAGLFLALARPFVSIAPEGLTYRKYGTTVHASWDEIERVLVTPVGEPPQLVIVRRVPDVLEMVEIVAGGWSSSARRERLLAVANAAAPHLGHRSLPTHVPFDLSAQVDLEQSMMPRSRVLINLVVLLACWVFGPPWLKSYLVMSALIGLFMSLFPPRSQRPFTSFRFSPDGVDVVRGSGRRSWRTHIASRDVERVLVTEGLLRPRLAILRADHAVLLIPRSLLGGRDRSALADARRRAWRRLPQVRPRESGRVDHTRYPLAPPVLV